MIEFPEEFTDRLRHDIGEREADALLKTMRKPAPVTVRINPAKISDPSAETDLPLSAMLSISRFGYLLSERPVFTTDPLFQAGCYYVQEASSMVLEHYFSYHDTDAVDFSELSDTPPSGEGMRGWIDECAQRRTSSGLSVLDLCAAPGGKSTHLLSLLSDIPGSFLVSNEVIDSRVTVLADNVSRWGASNVVVTKSDPSDFRRFKEFFDIILIDAPCSGEGMFRKDERAIEEWSAENVRLCAARQRRIIADAVGSLSPGGLLIYSTCTFNRQENEDNTAWISSEYDMELLEQNHYYPGEEYGEGLFMAALRKSGTSDDAYKSGKSIKSDTRITAFKPYKGTVPFIKEGFIPVLKGDLLKVYPSDCAERMHFIESGLKTVKSGTSAASILTDRKGVTTLIPEPDLAFSEALRRGEGSFPEVEISFDEANRYMRCEAMTFPDAPKGYLLLTYRNHPLGFVKNIGSRANSLWPTSRRIRIGL